MADDFLVRFYAGAAAAAETDDWPVDTTTLETVQDLLDYLSGQREALAPIFEVATFLCAGKPVTDRTLPLAQLAAPQLDVLPPFAGG
ncbi:hypothetical protein BSR28_01130 [Boudabousia liubingyangii]|uniref:hypothetical protein n=1 Tax=Boudabousia liubingyangii TaxID=1921764 RepID=UPI00093D5247|nr:hypothetical protein [Boudabousia liubingyangii]OKL48337.1 hypothetical protein BSR28_01130 [Boudabousia liubingyangii]